MKYIVYTGWSDDIVKLVGELANDEYSFSHMAADKKVVIMIPDDASFETVEKDIKGYRLLHRSTIERLDNISAFHKYLNTLSEEDK